MLTRCLVALTLIAAPALAEPAKVPKDAKAPKIEDTFGFDVMKSEKTKCAKVTGALLTKLTRSYRCQVPEIESASGLPYVAKCTAKKGDSAYMLFTTKVDCEKERETQVANGD
jgi:hypothetical protein